MSRTTKLSAVVINTTELSLRLDKIKKNTQYIFKFDGKQRAHNFPKKMILEPIKFSSNKKGEVIAHFNVYNDFLQKELEEASAFWDGVAQQRANTASAFDQLNVLMATQANRTSQDKAVDRLAEEQEAEQAPF